MRLEYSTTEEAWTSLHTNIGSKLKYTLSACTLTKDECKLIMFSVIKAALPRADIALSISIAFRDCPINSLGAGILSMYHFVGTSRTSILVDKINKKTQLGTIMIGNIKYIILDAGLFGSSWELPFDTINKYVA